MSTSGLSNQGLLVARLLGVFIIVNGTFATPPIMRRPEQPTGQQMESILLEEGAIYGKISTDPPSWHGDVWTKSFGGDYGTQCWFDHSRNDCAECKEGGCQCGDYGEIRPDGETVDVQAHRCSQCGQGLTCPKYRLVYQGTCEDVPGWEAIHELTTCSEAVSTTALWAIEAVSDGTWASTYSSTCLHNIWTAGDPIGCVTTHTVGGGSTGLSGCGLYDHAAATQEVADHQTVPAVNVTAATLVGAGTITEVSSRKVAFVCKRKSGAKCAIPSTTNFEGGTASGENCTSGSANVGSGTTCELTQTDGHHCKSPGSCIDGQFSGTGEMGCVEAQKCKAPLISEGLHGWSGENCEASSTTNTAMVVSGTTCELICQPGYTGVSPGLCNPDGNFTNLAPGCSMTRKPCPPNYPICKLFDGWQHYADGTRINFDDGNKDCVIAASADWDEDADWKFAEAGSITPSSHYNRIAGYNAVPGDDCTENYAALS